MTAKNCTAKSKQSPKLRHHKATGQAYAVLNGKAVYFGRYDDPEAAQKYHQHIAEWLAAGKMDTAPSGKITVEELIARFWEHAKGYYVHADGTPTHEPMKIAMPCARYGDYTDIQMPTSLAPRRFAPFGK